MRTARRIIGVDESGKGDFFGPLVIAGCLAGSEDIAFLTELGVRDSKKIAPKKLLSLDEMLRSRLVHTVIVYLPEEYNRLYVRLKNLNKLLAIGHARCIEGVLNQKEADLAISDKFGKEERLEDAMAELECNIPIEQIVRGEAIPQVAAASIIARAEFVRQIDKLSSQCQMTIPKGASALVDEVGRHLVAEHGAEILSKVAKTHFKNYGRAMKPKLPLQL
ncbi:MAG: ribonuclease HIII [Candidatus Zixiibacteriota bacterium]|nr:MAG: ribonuclease HIII [candidate division Zixibacteria bacterium]